MSGVQWYRSTPTPNNILQVVCSTQLNILNILIDNMNCLLEICFLHNIEIFSDNMKKNYVDIQQKKNI